VELNVYDCYVHITGFDVLIINVYNQFLSPQDKPFTTIVIWKAISHIISTML